MSHPQYTGRPKSAIQLTERQKEYITNKYQTLSVCAMASNIHVPAKLIYDYMNEKGWKSFDGRKKVREPNSDGLFNWRDFGNDMAIG